MQPLERVHARILRAHVALAVVLWLLAFVSASGGDGWTDLARAAVTVLGVAYVAGVGVAWLAMRYVMGERWMRILLAIAGPPVVFVLTLLLLRAG